MTIRDRAIVARWKPRVVARRALVARARRAHGAHPTAATKSHLAMREGQLARAQRIVLRHAGVTGMSSAGIAFVMEMEGGQSPDGLFHPYRDAVGVWTIGYGETRGATPGMRPWSRRKAASRLRSRLNRDYLPAALDLYADLGIDIKQGEADAQGSFCYNLGPGYYRAGSTMGDAVRTKRRLTIADAFLVYDKAGGRRLAGLTRRREGERRMYLAG